jgi:carbon monoxide dehydrogenase subunit G
MVILYLNFNPKTMKILLKSFLMMVFLASTLAILNGCDDDDDPGPKLTGNSKTYDLEAVSNAAVSGTVTFAEQDDDRVRITIQLTGTQAGGTHPAHLHANSAAEGGAIVLDLAAVNGSGGKSETIVGTLKDGTAITYNDFLSFDGHVNVHASADNLGTLIAQGDIGQNELTGDTKEYALGPVADPGISGTATFAKRVNGETLVTVSLTGTADGESYPSHIHNNSAVETGGVAIGLNNVDGTTGEARTNVSQLDDGTAITYDGLLNFDGYLNVHSGSTLIAQGDIGANELTGTAKVYTLTPGVDPAVTGTATFAERKNGKALVTVAMTNTTPGTLYSSHIHANTIAETGGIVIDLNKVDGTTGMARTSVDTLRDGTPITYAELLDFDGHLNVHTTGGYLGQVDIGQNELTGASKEYVLSPVIDPNVTGTATFEERKNGKALVTVALTSTTAGTLYSSHIHANTIAETGGIMVDLHSVDGTTGIGRTSVDTLRDGSAISYAELLDYNGHLNVHSGSSYLAQGDIGQNELTGQTKEYALAEVGGSGVSGTATFAKRRNGKTQITISLTGTVTGGDHPAHIHANDVATGGSVVLTLENVAGDTGKSVTSAHALNDTTPITYDQLITYDGHINVHLSAVELSTLIARGNIGSNAP